MRRVYHKIEKCRAMIAAHNGKHYSILYVVLQMTHIPYNDEWIAEIRTFASDCSLIRDSDQQQPHKRRDFLPPILVRICRCVYVNFEGIHKSP